MEISIKFMLKFKTRASRVAVLFTKNEGYDSDENNAFACIILLLPLMIPDFTIAFLSSFLVSSLVFTWLYFHCTWTFSFYFPPFLRVSLLSHHSFASLTHSTHPIQRKNRNMFHVKANNIQFALRRRDFEIQNISPATIEFWFRLYYDACAIVLKMRLVVYCFIMPVL